MGKSNKKVRNDRINAIRKQYDAFLDEDKRRRERNEYILGKLDKMRSSSALVHTSNKANYYMEFNPSEIFMRPNNLRAKTDVYISQLESQNMNSSILNESGDQLRILKEISKKYILIPKRTPVEHTNNIYNKYAIDDDWKSKYNILDDLKKLEKEGQSDNVIDEYDNDKNNTHKSKLDLSMESNSADKQPSDNLDKLTSDKSYELSTVNKPDDIQVERDDVSKHVNFNVDEISSQNNRESQIPLQIASMSPNETVKLDQKQCELNTPQERNSTPEDEIITDNEKYHTEGNEKDLNVFKNITNDSLICEMSNFNNSTTVGKENVNTPDYSTSPSGTKEFTVPENIKEDGDSAFISDQTISYAKPLDSSTIEYSEETVHVDPNIDDQKDITEITSTERVELYDDIDNNPEGEIVINNTILENPPLNTIPVKLENVQDSEHIAHESEINAFEAEQKEMFYSEQPQADTYAYNEGNAEEYTGSYEQNDQYAYYEGGQQEQTYATNINEHEESTERYDPQYNQQYEGTYEIQQADNTVVGYDNTNEYEQQFQDENQQLQNIANYENNQDNTHLYQQENISDENEVKGAVLPPQEDQTYDQRLYAEPPGAAQEEIEQQLIVEEGYPDISPANPEGLQKENEGEINITATPEEPMPDTKLA